MSHSKAAISLRESFGDRKIPEISRKITACVACRKLKIKCSMDGEKPPCRRCQARGNSCTTNKSLQSLLESDASWKEKMEQRLEMLEKILPVSNGTLEFVADSPPPMRTSNDTELDEVGNSPVQAESIPQPKAVLNLSCGLGHFPASSIINFTANYKKFGAEQQLSASCKWSVPVTALEDLFAFFQRSLDFHTHTILSERDSFSIVHERSSLLSIAISTVAALCSGSPYFQNLRDSLKSEVSSKLFANEFSFDDVRGLCVGSLWLDDISTALSGIAVRVATDLDLHRCISKMPHKKKECYERTRLYFLVYICDHHCSLGQGKPPMTRDFRSLKSPRDFLKTEFASKHDLKLISQVELWSIGNRVFDTFGADVDGIITSQKLAEISFFDIIYEQWRSYWIQTSDFGDGITNFSRSIFDLYYYSSKLYLFSHVFRGKAFDKKGVPTQESNNVGDFSSRALQNALSILCCIINGNQIGLHKLPHHLRAVTAFASICLVKAEEEGRYLFCEKDNYGILGHLRQLVQVLHESNSSPCSGPSLVGIAESLESALPKLSQLDHGQNFDLGWNGCSNFDLVFDTIDFPTGDAAFFPVASEESSTQHYRYGTEIL